MNVRLPRRVKRLRQERGAVALIVGVLSLVLLLVAAMSIDLGNAWARKRQVQSQVDIAALAGGYLLPATTQAKKNQVVAVVATYLSKNHVAGQPTITAADLTDTDPDNGQIQFFNRGSTVGAYYTVTAPRATVSYGLSRVVGQSSTRVAASATVEIESQLPPMDDALPFWMPTGCPYGPGLADTASGPSTPTTTAAPTTSAGPFVPPMARASHSTGSVSPNSLAYQATGTISVTITNVPKNSDGGTIRFTYDSATIVDYTATWPRTAAGDTVTVNNIAIGTPITSHPGAWKVWPLVKSGSLEYPVASGTFTVTGGPTASPSPSVTTPTATPSGVGCNSSVRGEFGQLDSPRASGNDPTSFALNIAVGLDHQVVPFINPPSENCGKKNGTAIAGGQYDEVSRPGNNCIFGDTGNDGPKMFDGFIAGVSGVKGRLDVANGTTNPACGRTNLTVKGFTLNNDVLSCYLKGTYSLNDIAQDSGVTTAMLDSSVIKSPRFVWIPVVFSVDRSIKDYQPLRRYVPAFVTDESRAAKKGASDATSDNGVITNGNSVKSVQVFMFNRDALPPDVAAPDAPAFNPELQSVPRLVN